MRSAPPSAPTPVASPSTPKRDHLLATASRLFYRDGYHAVGIDTILAEAKLAKMTLYHHFASKEELIVAVLERRAAEVQAGMKAAVDAAGPSTRKRLLAVFDEYERWFASPGFNGCAFIRAVAEYPQIDSPVHQAVMRQKQRTIEMLIGLLQAADAPRPEETARQIYLLLEGAIVSAHTFGDPAAARQARAAALALIRPVQKKKIS